MADTNKTPTTPQDLTALEQDALSEDIRSLGITVPPTVDEHKRALIEMENALTRAAAQQGLMFLTLKDRLEHGDFENWIEAAGFNSRTVRRKMQTAKFLLQQPKNLQPKLIGMSQQKLTELSKSDPDIVDQLLDSGESVDDLTQLSYTDMRARIRKLETQATNLEVKLESAESEKNTISKKLQRLTDNQEYPDFVIATRHESNALTEQAWLCLDDLDRLLTELEQLPSASGDNFNIALNTLYRHVNALAKRSGQIVNRVRENHADHINDDANLIYLPDEIEAAIAVRRQLVAAHEHEKLLRGDQRERAKPKKAGRPKAPKAKPKK